jgi:hypothetical protein
MVAKDFGGFSSLQSSPHRRMPCAGSRAPEAVRRKPCAGSRALQRADARIDRGSKPATRCTGLRLLRLAAGAERGGLTWRLNALRRKTVRRGTFFQGPGP